MKHGALILICPQALLALPVESILEVSRMVEPCAKLLRVPSYVLGAVDFHGRVVPLLDLAARLGLCAPRKPLDLATGYIVFLDLSNGVWGFAVDGVEDLVDVQLDPLSVSSPQLSGLVVGSLRISENERALLLQPSGLGSVVTTAKLAKELAELSRGSA